jgi:hypothetical protein
VPDSLRVNAKTGVGVPYSENQAEHMAAEHEILPALDAWADQFAQFVREKGKVTPGEHRAYGYRAPRHFWADVKLGWRDARMRLGVPRAGSSPAVQQAQGLNEDATLTPKASERDKHAE